MSVAHGKPLFLLRTIRLGVVLSLLLVGVSGCAEKKGDVSGLVSFNGSPLPAGKITFICEGGDKPVLIADIRDGKYEIKGIPVGTVKITVATHKPSKAGERRQDWDRHSGQTVRKRRPRNLKNTWRSRSVTEMWMVRT